MNKQNYIVDTRDRIEIHVIGVERVRELRASVLRPDQKPEMAVFLGDDAADTLHLGAFNRKTLVGVATLLHQAPKEFSGHDADALWLLRGMATLPQVRGQGYGAALVAIGCAYVACEHGNYLWCDARESARGFYEKLGFVTQGNRFDIPPTGPHYRMWRPISDEDATNALF